jgi:hypothetical protein
MALRRFVFFSQLLYETADIEKRTSKDKPMQTKKKAFHFYVNNELDELLKEFQQKNKIVSKSEAMRLLLSTGLRNWTHPEEAHTTEKTVQSGDEKTKKTAAYYELITGSKT